jgi:transcriptional regulator with XRE-family HTH domain
MQQISLSTMQKEKLKQIRLQKGYTQQQLADFIHTDVSNYCRKENGSVGITKKEWEKLSGFLEVREEDIFEESEKQVSIMYENSTIAENSGNFSTYSNIPDSIVKNLQDFIVMLQEENKRLREEIDFMRGNNI